jgi:hypothetical protein
VGDELTKTAKFTIEAGKSKKSSDKSEEESADE